MRRRDRGEPRSGSVRRELPRSRSSRRGVPPKRSQTQTVDSLVVLSSNPGSQSDGSRTVKHGRARREFPLFRPDRLDFPSLHLFVDRPQASNPRLFDWRLKRVKALDSAVSWPGRRPGRKQMKAKSTIVGLTGEPISRRGLIVSAGAAGLAAAARPYGAFAAGPEQRSRSASSARAPASSADLARPTAIFSNSPVNRWPPG